jgi:hypothetical protein
VLPGLTGEFVAGLLAPDIDAVRGLARHRPWSACCRRLQKSPRVAGAPSPLFVIAAVADTANRLRRQHGRMPTTLLVEILPADLDATGGG